MHRDVEFDELSGFDGINRRRHDIINLSDRVSVNGGE
jgi:hypothetical protein